MGSALFALVVSLEANMAKFVDGMSKASYQAEKSVKQIQGTIEGLKGSITSLIELAGGVYVINRLWEGFKGITEADLALQRLAERLGVSTEQLSEMQYAAKRSGVDLESFNAGVTRFEKNISAAALANEQASTTILDVGESTNKAAAALRELGLKADVMRTMPLKDQLLAVAVAMAQVPQEADKVRIAMDLFGRGAGNMVALFKQGPEAIQGFIDRGRQLGVVLSGDVVSRGAAAAASLNQLRDAGKGLAITATDLVAPGLTKVVDGLTQKIVAARESGAATKTLTQITSLFGKVWDEPGLSALKNGIIGAQLWGIKGAALGAASGFMGLRLELKTLATILNDPMLSTLLMAGMGAMAGKTFGVAGAAVGAVAGAGTAVAIGIKRDAAKYQQELAKAGAPDLSGVLEEMPLWPQGAQKGESLLEALNWNEQLQKARTTPTRAKPESGKGGAEKSLSGLMNIIDQLEKEYAKFTQGAEAETDAWYQHMVNRIRGVAEVMQDPAQAQAKALELAGQVMIERKKRQEEDYQGWLAEAYYDTEAKITNDRQKKLRDYLGNAQKQEEINAVFGLKLAEERSKKESELQGLVRGYYDSLAGLTPLLSQQLTYKQQALDLEKGISAAGLEREIIEKRIPAAQADELRGLLALTNQAKQFNLERDKWQTQVMGGLKGFALQQIQESETFGYKATLDLLKSFKDGFATSLADGLTAFMKGEKGVKLEDIGWKIVAGLNKGLADTFTNQLFTLLSQALLNAFGISLPTMQTGAQTAATTLAAGGLAAGQNLVAAAYQAAAILSGSSVSAKASTTGNWPGTDFSSDFWDQMYSAGGYHSGGVIKAHSGWPRLRPDEIPIIAQTGERVLSREQNRAYEAGMARPQINLIVNNNHSQAVVSQEQQSNGNLLVTIDELNAQVFNSRGKFYQAVNRKQGLTR